MSASDAKMLVAYLSPAGTTRHAAGVIEARLVELGHSPRLLNLSASGNANAAIARELKAGDCLWIGSPIYARHPLPAVMDFISALPDGTGAFAAPFATYGAVNSGTALFEMGEALSQKGFKVLGGAKIVALHSAMWPFANPLGEGRPNAEDDRRVREFVQAVHEKTTLPGNGPSFDVQKLNYQPPEQREAAKQFSLSNLLNRVGLPKFNEESCTQCGICEDNCPSGNITLDPYPRIGQNCIACCNCVRLCEPGAITHEALGGIEQHIRAMAAEAPEKHETEIFV